MGDCWTNTRCWIVKNERGSNKWLVSLKEIFILWINFIIFLKGPVAKKLKKSKIISDLGGDDDLNGDYGET